jgi:D-alanyl-D-alanine carboxypeptidase/D-alanyl-D-alanine-endopeptidase (penicillin-binding protein 4)
MPRNRLTPFATIPTLAALLLAAVPAWPQRKSQPTSAATAKVRRDVARFRNRVDAVLSDAPAQKALWGILVVDANSGSPLYEINADRSFSPASSAKLFTTALAMATLGPEYRFRTTIEARGTLDSNGRLHGDLVFVGRGDPGLSNRMFPYAGKVERDGPADKILEEMAGAVVAKGVKEIDGDIVGDDSYFPYDPYPAGWEIGDLYFTFGAPVSAIALNDNAITVNVTPGEQSGAPAGVEIEPWDGQGTIGYEISTGPIGSKPDFEVIRQPGAEPILLRGSIPIGHAPMKLDLALEEPAGYTARILKRLLESRGVHIAGQARAFHALLPRKDAPALTESSPQPGVADSLVLAEHVSLPLLESIRLTNKVSQNLHAELFLRTVAKEKTGIGSLEAGLKVEQDFLKSIGIADGDVLLADGSGLSRSDLVTPRATVALLRWVAQQPWADAFLSTLPVAGKDGTLEPRMKESSAAGRVQAKTGSLEHARSICGFATSLAGERLVFAMFANNHPNSGHEANNVLDAIAVAMVEELGATRPLVKKKR